MGLVPRPAVGRSNDEVFPQCSHKRSHISLISRSNAGSSSTVRDDPQLDRHDEYRQVQAAKLIHRMAGGTHKRWERELPNGSIEVSELHKYPVSRGRVLRVLGREVAAVCGQLGVAE